MIKYVEKDRSFILETEKTSYVLELIGDRYLVNLHYGKKGKRVKKREPVWLGYGAYSEEYGNKCCPDELSNDISFYGSGSYRRTALRIRGKDGTGVTDFRYVSHRIQRGRGVIDGLPSARIEEGSETLEILMTDTVSELDLHLYYTTFPESDVISRYMTVTNRGDGSVRIESCMPLELVLDREGLDMITLFGKHANEFNYQRVPTHHGIQAISSRRGASSHQYNPHFALASHGATENKGEAWGFNLVYSGSFLGEVEVDQCRKTVVHLGLGTEDFGYVLEGGESFDSPEAVLTYSCQGIGGMSRNFHRFVKSCILPPESVGRPHPVVLNTWEACYFNIDEEKLLTFADKASDMGFDMLVVDDGWFGERDHDRAGLGDWYPNKRKFPRGLSQFARDLRARGLGFGIWIEPEMVNPDSDLYRLHPEWALHAEGREPLLSRNQLTLDMSQEKVVDYLIDSFERVFGDVSPDYFKWDMNRHMTGVGSSALSPERQCEVSFRYMKGVYRLLTWLRERFPNAFLETCSGGGGRYDLGMMSYGMQIWTSDRTNPYDRTRIQRGALLGYPAVTMSCHVSYPYGSVDKLIHRYRVAIGGMLGYELDILEMSDEINEEIKRQIVEYKGIEHVIRLGEYYRVDTPSRSGYSAFFYAMPDGDEVLLTVVADEKCKLTFTNNIKLPVNAEKIYKDTLGGGDYSGDDLLSGITLPIPTSEGRVSVYHFKA